jgi:hypothetical protein
LKSVFCSAWRGFNSVLIVSKLSNNALQFIARQPLKALPASRLLIACAGCVEVDLTVRRNVESKKPLHQMARV